MSFREITMQEISEMLRRHQAGHSARRIARDMGLDRKTVHRYLNEAQSNVNPRPTPMLRALVKVQPG
jgi:response regulator of citrate/malate metabolism